MRINEADLRRMVRQQMREMMGYPGDEGPGGGLTWDDFAPFGLDQIGEAFLEAGGDPLAALEILNSGLGGDDDYAWGEES